MLSCELGFSMNHKHPETQKTEAEISIGKGEGEKGRKGRGFSKSLRVRRNPRGSE